MGTAVKTGGFVCVHATRGRTRGRALILAGGLVLAIGLAACSGSSDDDPVPAVPVEPPAPATLESAPETSEPPVTPSDPPLPGAPTEPGEPDPPTAVPPTAPALPGTSTSELPTELGEPAAQDPAESPVEPTVPAAETRILRYDTFDLSGAVAEPGHYAFLADPNDPSSAVSTYEELRDGTATALLIDTHDAHGVSQVTLYDAVEPGDLFE